MARHPRIKVTEDYVDMTALALDSVAIDLASGTPVDETVDRLRRIADNMRRKLGATCEEQHGHPRRINHQRVWARVASEYEVEAKRITHDEQHNEKRERRTNENFESWRRYDEECQ